MFICLFYDGGDLSMFKSQRKDPVEREALIRQETEKIRKVPGAVDSEKIQGTDGEIALMQEERHHFSCKK